MRKVTTTIEEIGAEIGQAKMLTIESDWVQKRDRVVLKFGDDLKIRLLAKDLIAAVENATNFDATE